MKKKVLIFTDSRGQHKPAGQSHKIFGELMLEDKRLDVDLFLCPMKWTTTLDFLTYFNEEKLAEYDAVILWTGIVDWSPRPVSSAVNDLYDNATSTNLDNISLNTRDYSKKVINNKKVVFDRIFGEGELAAYYSKPFEVTYAGEKTINMYSLEMARDKLLPILQRIPNLIYITANRFVPGWEGDFKKGRPQNISASHAYSDLFAEKLSETAKVIDLREWSEGEIKRFTCDNIHITEAGSQYIYDRLMGALGLAPAAPVDVRSKPVNEFEPMRNPERIVGAKRQVILNAVGAPDRLATLIIGVRVGEEDAYRYKNLSFLLKWIRYYYDGLFDVLLVEQDSEPRLDMARVGAGGDVRYEFIYNPDAYNRGWGYNVAVKHFCNDAKVVVLLDTDVLLGSNFLREVMDCHLKYDAISPYRNIYYTDEEEAQAVSESLRLNMLKDPARIKNPVTLTGGILIIKRDIFLGLKGFEQYVGYGCEDRALDVTLLNHIDQGRLRVAPYTYVHLYHPREVSERARFDEIYNHLVTHYGCKYNPGISPFESIHRDCAHANRAATLKLMVARSEWFGDRDAYRSGHELSVNGLPEAGLPDFRESELLDVIYPNEFDSLSSYRGRETYANAPDPDSEELSVLYNAFKGKRCFIIGNGPSLNKHDLSLLEGEYTFGVNSFYYKTRETGFRPFFYVVEDSSVMKENIEEIRNYYAPFKFFPTNYRTLHPKQPNTFFFRMNRGFYEKSSPNYVVPRFSTDASDVLYCGQSVTYINLQLAYFMGFEEVYLIGMDFDYVIPKSHARTGDVLLSDTDDPNHFHKDYFGKGKTWKDPKLDRVALNYKMAKLVFEATGRKIYNATVGGRLEIFDRVDYTSLFRHKSRVGRIKVPTTLAEANERFREEDYSSALAGYVQLARRHPKLDVYKRNAISAFQKAEKRGQYCNPVDAKFAQRFVDAQAELELS